MNFTMTAIDSAIGMIFVYLLMASICSVLQEIFANIISWRGKHLRNSIQSMLKDPDMTGLAKDLYANPRIATLIFAGKLPSYIPSATFAAALVDVISKTFLQGGKLVASADSHLAPFINDAEGDIEKVKAEFSKWFDDAMDSFGGWYKRNVQIVLFFIALAIAAVLNVNSLSIARALWTQPALRDAVVQSAANFHQQGNSTNPSATPEQQFSALQNELDNLPLPIGWSSASVACLFGDKAADSTPPVSAKSPGLPTCDSPQGILGMGWLALIAGWIATALATSLGTQFWFQTLGSALQLRAAGAKPGKDSGADASTK
jgi:hypothetical protein